MIPVANAADYLRALPDARLATLPGLGHVPHEEAPDRDAGVGAGVPGRVRPGAPTLSQARAGP